MYIAGLFLVFIILVSGSLGSYNPCPEYGSTTPAYKSDCGNVVPHPPQVFRLSPVVMAPVVKTVPRVNLKKHLEDMTVRWLKMKADLKSQMLANLKSLRSSLKSRSHQPLQMVLLPVSIVSPKYAPVQYPTYSKPTTRYYPVYTKPSTVSYPAYSKYTTYRPTYTKPPTRSYPVYTQYTTRSYPVYTKPPTISYPVYTKPTTLKPVPTALCCLNIPISNPSKYPAEPNPPAPTYITDLYKSGSQNVVQALNQTLVPLIGGNKGSKQ